MYTTSYAPTTLEYKVEEKLYVGIREQKKVEYTAFKDIRAKRIAVGELEHGGLSADVIVASSSCCLGRYDNVTCLVGVTFRMGYEMRYFTWGEEVGKSIPPTLLS
jgi:hypothetical protein